MKPLKELHKKACFSAISDDGTFATVLHVICLHSYGQEIYEADLLDLRERLIDDFHAELSEANESKLNAILLATSTDAFYDDPEAFRGISNTLVDGDPGIDMGDDLTLPEIMWATYEVNLNHGEGQFGTSVQNIISRVMEAESQDFGSEDEDPMAYIHGAMEEAQGSLLRQLEEIGLDDPELPPIRSESAPPLLVS